MAIFQVLIMLLELCEQQKLDPEVLMDYANGSLRHGCQSVQNYSRTKMEISKEHMWNSIILEFISFQKEFILEEVR